LNWSEFPERFTREPFPSNQWSEDPWAGHCLYSAATGAADGDARPARAAREARDELEKNREQLFALGLWGVPSFRVLGGNGEPYSTWGQDRLWRVDEEIRRRL
jgi:2-hydroxychromene-2-carboxylate isomerase